MFKLGGYCAFELVNRQNITILYLSCLSCFIVVFEEKICAMIMLI